MKKKTILVAAIALILGASVGYITYSENEMEHMVFEAGVPIDHSMMMVESEKEFLEVMIPHHQEAVDTAKEIIQRDRTTKEVYKLATDIIVTQEKEIANMKQWYMDWYGEEYLPTGNYMTMMRDLEPLKGKVLDIVFLEDMIKHHQGAIMMAASVQDHLEHIEINDLTIAIKRTQTEEMRLMEGLLSELK